MPRRVPRKPPEKRIPRHESTPKMPFLSDEKRFPLLRNETAARQIPVIILDATRRLCLGIPCRIISRMGARCQPFMIKSYSHHGFHSSLVATIVKWGLVREFWANLFRDEVSAPVPLLLDETPSANSLSRIGIWR